MDDHPGVSFHASAAHGRAVCLAGGPDSAEVIDVLMGLDAQGEDRIAETATRCGIPPRMRVAMRYDAAFRDEIDHQIDLRRREAAELRGRHVAEQLRARGTDTKPSSPSAARPASRSVRSGAPSWSSCSTPTDGSAIWASCPSMRAASIGCAGSSSTVGRT